jgi:hypothetical protein
MEAKGKTVAANEGEMADTELESAIFPYLYLNAIEPAPPARVCKRHIDRDGTARRLHVSNTLSKRAKRLPSIARSNGTVLEGSFMPRRHAESSVLQRLICGLQPQPVLVCGD